MSSYTYVSVKKSKNVVFDDLTKLNADLSASGVSELWDDYPQIKQDPRFKGMVSQDTKGVVTFADIDEGNAFDGYKTGQVLVWGCFGPNNFKIIANHMTAGELIIGYHQEGWDTEYYTLTPGKSKKYVVGGGDDDEEGIINERDGLNEGAMIADIARIMGGFGVSGVDFGAKADSKSGKTKCSISFVFEGGATYSVTEPTPRGHVPKTYIGTPVDCAREAYIERRDEMVNPFNANSKCEAAFVVYEDEKGAVGQIIVPFNEFGLNLPPKGVPIGNSGKPTIFTTDNVVMGWLKSFVTRFQDDKTHDAYFVMAMDIPMMADMGGDGSKMYTAYKVSNFDMSEKGLSVKDAAIINNKLPSSIMTVKVHGSDAKSQAFLNVNGLAIISVIKPDADFTGFMIDGVEVEVMAIQGGDEKAKVMAMVMNTTETKFRVNTPPMIAPPGCVDMILAAINVQNETALTATVTTVNGATITKTVSSGLVSATIVEDAPSASAPVAEVVRAPKAGVAKTWAEVVANPITVDLSPLASYNTQLKAAMEYSGADDEERAELAENIVSDVNSILQAMLDIYADGPEYWEEEGIPFMIGPMAVHDEKTFGINDQHAPDEYLATLFADLGRAFTIADSENSHHFDVKQARKMWPDFPKETGKKLGEIVCKVLGQRFVNSYLLNATITKDKIETEDCKDAIAAEGEKLGLSISKSHLKRTAKESSKLGLTYRLFKYTVDGSLWVVVEAANSIVAVASNKYVPAGADDMKTVMREVDAAAPRRASQALKELFFEQTLKALDPTESVYGWYIDYIGDEDEDGYSFLKAHRQERWQINIMVGQLDSNGRNVEHRVKTKDELTVYGLVEGDGSIFYTLDASGGLGYMAGSTDPMFNQHGGDDYFIGFTDKDGNIPDFHLNGLINAIINYDERFNATMDEAAENSFMVHDGSLNSLKDIKDFMAQFGVFTYRGIFDGMKMVEDGYVSTVVPSPVPHQPQKPTGYAADDEEEEDDGEDDEQETSNTKFVSAPAPKAVLPTVNPMGFSGTIAYTRELAIDIMVFIGGKEEADYASYTNDHLAIALCVAGQVADDEMAGVYDVVPDGFVSADAVMRMMGKMPKASVYHEHKEKFEAKEVGAITRLYGKIESEVNGVFTVSVYDWNDITNQRFPTLDSVNKGVVTIEAKEGYANAYLAKRIGDKIWVALEVGEVEGKTIDGKIIWNDGAVAEDIKFKGLPVQFVDKASLSKITDTLRFKKTY